MNSTMGQLYGRSGINHGADGGVRRVLSFIHFSTRLINPHGKIACCRRVRRRVIDFLKIPVSQLIYTIEIHYLTVELLYRCESTTDAQVTAGPASSYA